MVHAYRCATGSRVHACDCASERNACAVGGGVGARVLHVAHGAMNGGCMVLVGGTCVCVGGSAHT